MQHWFILLPHLVNISARVSTEISTFTVSLLYMHCTSKWWSPARFSPSFREVSTAARWQWSLITQFPLSPPKKNIKFTSGRIYCFKPYSMSRNFGQTSRTGKKRKITNASGWRGRHAWSVDETHSLGSSPGPTKTSTATFSLTEEWQGTEFLVINLGGTGRWPSLHQDFLVTVVGCNKARPGISIDTSRPPERTSMRWKNCSQEKTVKLSKLKPKELRPGSSIQPAAPS